VETLTGRSMRIGPYYYYYCYVIELDYLYIIPNSTVIILLLPVFLFSFTHYHLYFLNTIGGNSSSSSGSSSSSSRMSGVIASGGDLTLYSTCPAQFRILDILRRHTFFLHANGALCSNLMVTTA